MIKTVELGKICHEDVGRQKDALLDVYSFYLETRIPSIKEEVIARAFELHLKDPCFCFIV